MARPKVLGNVRRMMVSLPEELAKAVDDYRFANRIKTDADTIRRLIEAGLSGQVAQKSEAGSSSKPSSDQAAGPGASKPARPRRSTPRAKPAALERDAR